MTNDDLDDLGYEKVQHSFDRGDYLDSTELKTVKKWLHSKEKEHKFLAACERASISSALEAKRAARQANLVAFLALVISVISAREHVGVLVESLCRYFGL